eukprot:1841694-Pyramimonas_sp.AAC.1
MPSKECSKNALWSAQNVLRTFLAGAVSCLRKLDVSSWSIVLVIATFGVLRICRGRSIGMPRRSVSSQPEGGRELDTHVALRTCSSRPWYGRARQSSTRVSSARLTGVSPVISSRAWVVPASVSGPARICWIGGGLPALRRDPRARK